jgi:endo-1,4-beta-xylanase
MNLPAGSCSRRTFLQLGSAAFLGGALAGCSSPPDLPALDSPTDPRSLRKLADELGIQWGTTLSGWLFQAEDLQLRARFRSTMEREFNLAMLGWGLFWASLEPREGELTFAIPDALVEYAQKNRLAACGHTLVYSTFPESLPGWLTRLRLSRAQMAKRLQEHVHRVVRRYQGRIQDWVVVNEPWCPPYRPRDFFVETIGPEYIELALEAARSADPNARLIYNDTQNHTPAGICYALTQKNLARLKARRLVDVVGLQMHLDGKNPPRREDLVDTIQRYELPVHVTELDINMKGTGRDQRQQFGAQARIFSEVVTAVLDAGVKSITVWEIGDKWSWLVKPTPGNPDVSPDAAPTLFDDQFEPKPGYQAVKSAFLAKLGR